MRGGVGSAVGSPSDDSARRPELGCHVGSERDRDVAVVTLPSGSGSVHSPLHARHGWSWSIIWSTEQAYSQKVIGVCFTGAHNVSRCRKSSATLGGWNGTEATLAVIVQSHVRPSPTYLASSRDFNGYLECSADLYGRRQHELVRLPTCDSLLRV